jgi:hypothetical protein
MSSIAIAHVPAKWNPVRRQGHAPTLESTAFSVHMGSPSDPISTESAVARDRAIGRDRANAGSSTSHRYMAKAGVSLVRSAQLRTKCRNLQQAIFSESAHTKFVYARSVRAMSRLCPRPLPAPSIITKPRLLPSVSFGLGIRPVACCHRPSFVSIIAPRHSRTLKSRCEATMTEPEGCSVSDIPPQLQVRFLNANLVVLYSAPN